MTWLEKLNEIKKKYLVKILSLSLNDGTEEWTLRLYNPCESGPTAHLIPSIFNETGDLAILIAEAYAFAMGRFVIVTKDIVQLRQNNLEAYAGQIMKISSETPRGYLLVVDEGTIWELKTMVEVVV